MDHEKTVLVTGATGKVGSELVSRLRAAGARVRALSRHPEHTPFGDGVDAVGGDLLRPASLTAALQGVDAVFLLWPAQDSQGARDLVTTIAAAARRVVLLSAMTFEDSPRGFWYDVEREVERAGVEWTFLRAGGFAGNALMWADQVRAGGVVRWPYAGAARSLVHEHDIADVAAVALTEDGHAGAKYVLTGPEVLTQAEQVATIGRALGRTLRYEELSRADARADLLARGWPATFADQALDAWAAMVDEPEPVVDTVREITGHPARTFAQWTTEHAADFR